MVSESLSSDHHGSDEAHLPALALVFSESGREVVASTGDAPTLPEVRILERFYPEIEEFVHAVENTLGVKVRVLRCLDRGNLDEGRPRLYSLATTGNGEYLRDGFRWTDVVEVCHLGGLDDSLTGSIRLECDRVSIGVTERAAVPWEWPGGWGHEAYEWIAGHLECHFSSGQVTLTPVRSWSISSVIRVDVETASGSKRLFFKASPTFFSKEAMVTCAVADRFPEFSPKLVAVDGDRGWMLMEDLGDLTLGATDSIDLWCEAMRALARVQIGFANDTSLLERLGLERRSISAIASTLRQWTHDPESLGLGYESGRTGRALERLVHHVELVDELCALVKSVRLPSTIDHGDLDAGNIFVRDGVPVIMDWSDSSISNPLFAPALIPQVSRNPILVSTFLEEWTGFGTVERLEKAFEASKPIAALERAFHYHKNIVAHLESPSVDLLVLESYIPDLLNLAAVGLDRHE